MYLVVFFFVCLFVPQVRLNLGMYIVFLLDWLSVFSKEQILVLRLEDYAANLKETIQKVFDFLSVGKCPKSYKNISQSDFVFVSEIKSIFMG